MRRTLLLVVFALACGCAPSGQYAVSASVQSPELVYVSPGVYAVAGYDEPVFYSDNYYWRYHDNYWYRSHTWNGGWRYYARPPRTIVSIDRPYRYVRVRPNRVIVDRRDRYDNRRPVYRDNRTYDRRDVRVRPQPQPRTDRRTDRRVDRRDRDERDRDERERDKRRRDRRD